jgi:uncharacterized membrane protein YqgA involved in biofilm formation
MIAFFPGGVADYIFFKPQFRKRGHTMVGPFVNTAAIIIGGIGGALLGERLPENFRERMPLIFGCCALGLGIALIGRVSFLPVPVLALLLGTIIGELLAIEEKLEIVADMLRKRVDMWVKPNAGLSRQAYMEQFISLMIIFCVSGAGIFGAMNEGITGDASLLIAKSFLDFFTAGIFATILGISVAVLALPQFVIQALLFFSAALIMPLTTPEIIGDFSAVGGLLLLGAGFRLCRLVSFPLANMLPSLLIAMPISAVWVRFFSV